MRYGWLILASDTVPGVLRARFPQPVAPDLGENVVNVGVAQKRPAPVHPLHDRLDVLRYVVHTDPAA
jgi:hypothetical protein